ncbi:hypothetical protein BOX15_Mlig005725g1 [Macrostomum lignano]|uniref:Uncharacterized protein n=1 Tax=Macrostomum lignano TaxID=282301 RepID=A0A267H3M7_9PLAT|nr:hypothetical protein BOX15_Mlig031061g1 [Macrostomum lignano]PAA92152.1 hypothetical protein BOX15_Mlig005725g1 [Macrostomum lignano]
MEIQSLPESNPASVDEAEQVEKADTVAEKSLADSLEQCVSLNEQSEPDSTQAQETNIDEVLDSNPPQLPQKPDFVPSLLLGSDEPPVGADALEPLVSTGRSWASTAGGLRPALPAWLARKLRTAMALAMDETGKSTSEGHCWSLPCSPRWQCRRWMRSRPLISARAPIPQSSRSVHSARSDPVSGNTDLSWTRIRALRDRVNAAQRVLEAAERFGSRGIEARRLLADSVELRRSVEELQEQQQQQQREQQKRLQQELQRREWYWQRPIWRPRRPERQSLPPSCLLDRLVRIRRDVVRSTFRMGLGIACQ